jgi:hypothetical protein
MRTQQAKRDALIKEKLQAQKQSGKPSALADAALATLNASIFDIERKVSRRVLSFLLYI